MRITRWILIAGMVLSCGVHAAPKFYLLTRTEILRLTVPQRQKYLAHVRLALVQMEKMQGKMWEGMSHSRHRADRDRIRDLIAQLNWLSEASAETAPRPRPGTAQAGAATPAASQVSAAPVDEGAPIPVEKNGKWTLGCPATFQGLTLTWNPVLQVCQAPQAKKSWRHPLRSPCPDQGFARGEYTDDVNFNEVCITNASLQRANPEVKKYLADMRTFMDPSARATKMPTLPAALAEPSFNSKAEALAALQSAVPATPTAVAAAPQSVPVGQPAGGGPCQWPESKCESVDAKAARSKYYAYFNANPTKAKQSVAALCIYSGNFRNYTTKDKTPAPGQCDVPHEIPGTNLKCSKGQAVCNPAVFGVRKDNQQALCVPEGNGATAACDGMADQAMPASREIFGDQWDAFVKDFTSNFKNYCQGGDPELGPLFKNFFCTECHAIGRSIANANSEVTQSLGVCGGGGAAPEPAVDSATPANGAQP